MEFIYQHPVLVAAIIKIAVLLFIVMTALAYLTWLERKAIAHIQSRWGPYNVGAHGLLQPLADGIKFLFKEDITPPVADKFVYTLAPFLALALGLTAIALIPFGPVRGPGSVPLLGQPAWAVTDINIGLLMLFAITSLGALAMRAMPATRTAAVPSRPTAMTPVANVTSMSEKPLSPDGPPTASTRYSAACAAPRR